MQRIGRPLLVPNVNAETKTCGDNGGRVASIRNSRQADPFRDKTQFKGFCVTNKGILQNSTIFRDTNSPAATRRDIASCANWCATTNLLNSTDFQRYQQSRFVWNNSVKLNQRRRRAATLPAALIGVLQPILQNSTNFQRYQQSRFVWNNSVKLAATRRDIASCANWCATTNLAEPDATQSTVATCTTHNTSQYVTDNLGASSHSTSMRARPDTLRAMRCLTDPLATRVRSLDDSQLNRDSQTFREPNFFFKK
ncbi:hypothetical protein J6590_103011 [Homalodisca vitripennis]|nr:hypothetical protein J6590_103011 [Homalodisca vitripennis]